MSLAEDFLQESIRHALVLEDKAVLGQAYLSQGVLLYQMGKLSLSRDKLEQAQPLIGLVPDWKRFVVAMAKVLHRCKAKAELHKMINQMSDVLGPLCQEEEEGKGAAEGSRLEMKQLCCTLDLLRVLY